MRLLTHRIAFSTLLAFLLWGFLWGFSLQSIAAPGTTLSAPEKEGSLSTDSPAAQTSETQINISDSIPIDTIIDKWEMSYERFVKRLGIEDSMLTRLLVTVSIILLFFIGITVSKRTTHFVRQKFYGFAKRLHVSEGKINFYHSALYRLFQIILALAVISLLALTWDIDTNQYIPDEFIYNTLANALTVFFIILAAILLIDVATGLVETLFIRWANASQSRIDTLLPLAKNTLSITIIVVFTLMLLAEIGINVIPLLAGAGVLGFAIGFGAQAIIKDILNGFIIILEDLIQVGDVVTLADRTGTIERITIRKVQLRSLDGVVYTVPFSEIAIVGNLTKEFSYAMFEVGVAYQEDIDEVSRLLTLIDEELRQDDAYRADIIETLEILGLDKFADSAVIIKARLKTRPSAQWKVGREFNRRIKKCFDKEHIEIPFPHQTIYFGETKVDKTRIDKTKVDEEKAV